jgi:benzoyl-CoA reductase/2-hydroxyglutaryl-CoA dehydratase subunit BcrC/BadD/HgdB
MADYDALLKLCGFDQEEISTGRTRIKKALQRLQLTPEDIKVAERWLPENHDLSLVGVRKILRILLNELFDMVLARDEGKKLLFYGFPTITGPAAAIASASDKIYSLCPDAILAITMGHIFNKINSIIETAEQNGLPPGHSLCSLQQTRVGGLVKGIIPVPDMVLTSSYYCDMGSKTDELLHERYGHPAVYVDGSMDSRWGEFPGYDPERIRFLGGELNMALDKVKDILGVEVTQEARKEGATRNRHIVKELNELVKLVKDADPQPISMVEVGLVRDLALGSGSKRVITELADAIKVLNDEVRDRIERGIGIIEKGAPRVAATLLNIADPTITHMIETHLSIPVLLLDLLNEKYKKPVDVVSGEPLAADEMNIGIFYGNCGFIIRAMEALKDSNLDGFVWNYLYNCHPQAQMSHLFAQFAEKQNNIPILSLESDLVDSRTYSAEAMRTRIETFAEILKAKKSAAK